MFNEHADIGVFIIKEKTNVNYDPFPCYDVKGKGHAMMASPRKEDCEQGATAASTPVTGDNKKKMANHPDGLFSFRKFYLQSP